ncbi:MAG: T9SS type A sorting domain-containing protein [Bacteroidota bacterium]
MFHLIQPTSTTDQDAEHAYAAIAREVRGGGILPGLGSFLTTQSNRESDRPWALLALTELHLAEGRTTHAEEAARMLTKEYTGTEHARYAWGSLIGVSIETGNAALAREALGALQETWSEEPLTHLIAADIAAHFDDREKRTPAASPLIARATSAVDEAFVLGAPYPNPASHTVTVPLVLREASEVRVVIYDLLGREVAVLAAGPAEPGGHLFDLDAGTLAPGVYVVQARSGLGTLARRFTVAR